MTKALQVWNLTEGQLEFVNVAEVPRLLLSQTALYIGVPNTESPAYNAALNRLLARAIGRVDSLIVQCTRTRAPRLQLLPLGGMDIIQQGHFQYLYNLTISLQLLVGDVWLGGPNRRGTAWLLQPGWMSVCFPLLREFRLVERSKYLAEWDKCGQGTGLAADDTGPICRHNSLLAGLLQRFRTVWEKDGTSNRVLFKKFKFSTAGWRIMQTLGRMCLFLVLVQPGDVGFERNDAGFLRVHSPVTAREQLGELPGWWEQRHARMVAWNDQD